MKDDRPRPIRAAVPDGTTSPPAENRKNAENAETDVPSRSGETPGSVPGEPARSVSWRVPPGLAGLKAAGAAVFAALAVVLGDDPLQLTVAAATALLLAGMATRDLVAPVRLAADPGGITVVTGFAGRRRIAWSGVERIRVDVRRRLGLRAELVEIDIGETLFLYSAYELGAACDEVVATLRAIRTGR